MEVEKPVQSTNAPKPRWSVRSVCVVLAILFAGIFAASWWLTPIEPYATYEGSDLCLFSPDSTMIVTSGEGKGPLRVWDAEGGHELFSLAHDWDGNTVLFSPDSSLLAAHERKGDLKLWNARTGEEVASIATKSLDTVDFGFSPDGRFLVFQDYSNLPDPPYITFWNIDSKQEEGSVKCVFYSLVFAPDGRSFATSRDLAPHTTNELLLWKIDRVPVLVRQHRITARIGAFSPDLKTFAVADDLPDGSRQIAMWDMITGEKRWSVTINGNGRITSLSFDANGRVLTAYCDGAGGRTTLWDVTSTPKEIGSFSTVHRAISSPDGEWLAIPLDSGAKLIRVSAPEPGADLIVNGDRRTGWTTPSFSPDSKMVLVTGLLRSNHKPLLGNWLPEKFNPFPAVRDASVVRVWDTDSHREVPALYHCSDDPWFSPDGHVLATLREDRKAIDLWKVPFRASLWRILGWTVIVWLIVVLVGWAGVKMQRKMFSRTNAPLPRLESSDGKQPQPDSKEPPLPHDSPPS
jgi:WD40 repeat protein